MLLFIAIVSLLVWLYLAGAHGGFWRIQRFMLYPASTVDDASFVVAVIPARDEADVIAPCITSLLSQSGVRMHIFLVDDGSQDGTAGVALQAAEGAGKSLQLTIVQGVPLPAGWSGKLWAVQQGIERASGLNPDFLLLTDADIVHSPDNIQTLARLSQSRKYDLVSLMVKLHCRTLAERALIPAFVFFFLMLYPPSWIADSKRRTAGAAGGCMLIRPHALEKAGGIAAIRGEIIDDCALARRVKASGGRVWLGLTEETESIRPYGSFAAIGKMISRAAFSQLRHSGLLLLGTLLGLAITYLAPPLLVFSARPIAALLGAASWLLMAFCFLSTVRLYRLNLLWSLLLPLIALFYMSATLHSAFRFWSGRGGEWKGRVQDPVRPQ
jgi:hopene-associated glycosyltransferase HpnB